MTYKYTDSGGITLAVEPSNTITGACRIELEDPEGGTYSLDGDQICAIVEPAHIEDAAARIATAILEAGGLPAPIILRPPASLPEPVTELAGQVEVGRSQNPQLPVTLAIRGVSAHLTTDAARVVAAHLAARAGEAEDDPELLAAQNLGRLIEMYGASEACSQAAAKAILFHYELTERVA